MPKDHTELLKLLNAKPDFYKGKITAYDPERSGVGYLFCNEDIKDFPQAWDLFKAMGKAQAQALHQRRRHDGARHVGRAPDRLWDFRLIRARPLEERPQSRHRPAEGLHDGDLARRLHLQARQKTRTPASCSSITCCRSAGRTSSPTRPISIRCAPTLTARRRSRASRELIGDKARPGSDRSDTAGQSRPDQAARLPGEVAAGEEGAVSRHSGAPDSAASLALRMAGSAFAARGPGARLTCRELTNAHCRVPLPRARPHHAGRGGAAVARVLSELSHRARSSSLRRSSASTPILRASPTPISGSAFWTTIVIAGGMAVIAVPLGAMLAFLMVRTDVPGRALSRAVDADADLRFGGGDRLRLCGGDRAGRHSSRLSRRSLIGFVPWNLYSLLGADRDRRPDPCAARLSLQRRGAARA